MSQAGGNGGRSIRSDRRAGRRVIAAGSLLLLIGACAAGGQNARPVPRIALDPPGAFFAGAYSQIRDYYLDPVSVDTLASAGIASLDPGPDGLTLVPAGPDIGLLFHGAQFARLPRPDPNDSQGWAAVTSAAMAGIRVRDPALAGADDEQLYRRIFDGITGMLDRFTRYAGAEAAGDQRAARDGFGGIGVTINYDAAEPRIATMLADGPAARAGLRVDDVLIGIDGLPTAGQNQRQVTLRLRGRSGSQIQLAVKRPHRARPIAIAVQRGFIVPVSVTSEREGGLAIFHVAGFNRDTAKSLERQFSRLQAEMGRSLTGVVLDLRGNPGGLLDQAVDVAALFLDRGDIVSAAGRHPSSMQHFPARGADRTHGLPMVVLVNGGSASSAEIVAAALQDDGRAIIIGSSSYGKGTVQMVVTLENTGELTLTWARLITPSGYILHHHGVVPAFCTSAAADPAAPPDDPQRPAQIIERGLHPTPGIATRPRASLDDNGWEELRRTCPAETGSTTLDLAIARNLIENPSLYAQALTLPGIAVAHDPDGHAMRSALQ